MMNTLRNLGLGLALLACCGGALAGDPPAPCMDPCVPPSKRPSTEAPASGERLRQQALDKLEQRFQEADLDRDGALTEEEARKAGLGYVANHFAEIDTARRGRVTFEDQRRYMAQRRRQAMAEPPQR
ncbi:EF-hand domain-containing protein [Pseudoduganella namucuonensis]|uniref:EF-hand domain-containing protein n=1 Tax=Pseudoduganella namucuonensis TaxID=1035707 RepID=A0A1I7JDX8_9BURK|nr:EF-hand domain-containing protein [Pseudoduganella namucuonensis]SFU83348.1 hypothetical protein SAMN05216552_101134 [Pseudoduganella namucuonensis]